MNFSELVDIIKVGVAILGAVIVFIAFVIPLKKTFIPLCVQHGVPSFELCNRLALRFMIFVLLLHEAIFPLDRIFSLVLNLVVLRATIIPVIAIIVLLLIHSWFNHPEGIKGL